MTYILSSGRHATLERELADRQQGSSLPGISVHSSLELNKEHTRIEEDQTVCTNEVDTTSAGFATQQEHELLAFWIVELINELLSLVDGHCTVQSEVAVPECTLLASM